jgi:hypothetical protein
MEQELAKVGGDGAGMTAAGGSDGQVEAGGEVQCDGERQIHQPI